MKNTIIYIGPYRYNERELAQIIRRKMISKSSRNKKKYIRNKKHKCNYNSDIKID